MRKKDKLKLYIELEEQLKTEELKKIELRRIKKVRLKPMQERFIAASQKLDDKKDKAQDL